MSPWNVETVLDRNLQSTKGQHDSDANLATSSQLQFAQKRHGSDDSRNVGCNTQSRLGKVESRSLKDVSFCSLVLEILLLTGLYKLPMQRP